MTNKSRRHHLKGSETKKLFHQLQQTLGLDINQDYETKPRVEVEETENTEVFFINGEPLLAKTDGNLFPTLRYERAITGLPKIVVDMGAIPYVCKGADVMAPGITQVNGEFKENVVILIVDERHGKPLGVGLSLCGSEEMKTADRGKVVKNLHYVGDKIWGYIKGS
jgi:PUA domain protein